MIALFIVVASVAVVALAYVQARGVAWIAAVALWLVAAWLTGALSAPWAIGWAIVVAVVALPFALPPLRRRLVSTPLLAAFRTVLPPMSQTEREALEAGTVSWDGELFSGKPAWQRLLALERTRLTPEEQHFLDHEAETLCAMVSDWETTNVYKDLPPRAGSTSRTTASWA